MQKPSSHACFDALFSRLSMHYISKGIEVYDMRVA